MTTEDVVINNEAPNPSLEETAAKMGIDVESIDPSADEQSASKVVSEKILGKFNTQEDLVKAYRELEKKLSQGNKGDNKEQPQEQPKEEPKVDAKEEESPSDKEVTEDKQSDDPVDAAKEVAEKAGLDFDGLSSKYWEKGSLDDGDYETLAKAGIPRHIVDQFAEGQKAVIANQRNSVFNEVGGEANYGKMIEWAGKTFNAQEIEAFNEAINSSNMNTVILAAKGLRARYDADGSVEPQVRLTGNGNGAEPETFTTWREVTKAMSDPEYQKDAAYRAKVEAKLSRSTNLT